jgi:hypothetical protein
MEIRGPVQKRAKKGEEVMQIGETVVLVRNIEGVETGTHGRVIDVTADRVIVECKVRERLAVLLMNTWEVLPEGLWERLLRRRRN